MTRQALDLKRIRRNWERADAGLLEQPVERLGHVTTPLDPYSAGQQLLTQLRREVADEFPAKRDMLYPFLDRTEVIFERLRIQSSAGVEDVSALRKEFMSAINDLEDLCEALLGVTR